MRTTTGDRTSVRPSVTRSDTCGTFRSWPTSRMMTTTATPMMTAPAAGATRMTDIAKKIHFWDGGRVERDDRVRAGRGRGASACGSADGAPPERVDRHDGRQSAYTGRESGARRIRR